MAVFSSPLLGKASNSVDKTTMSYTGGKCIARARIFKRKDNPTPEVLNQRAKIKVLGSLGQRLLFVIRKGFVGIGRGSTSNAFVKENLPMVTTDEAHVATVDFDALKVAMGIVDTPKVTLSYDAASKMYTFTQHRQAENKNGFCLADDQVYGVLFETVRGRAMMLTLMKRGEGGTMECALPDEWLSENVKAYCFATTANGRRASDSLVLKVG